MTAAADGAGTSRLRRTLYPVALVWYSSEGGMSRGRAYRADGPAGRRTVAPSAGGRRGRFPPPPASPDAPLSSDAALRSLFLPSRMSSSIELRLVLAVSTSRRSSSAVVASPGGGGEASSPSGVERPVEVAIDRADAEILSLAAPSPPPSGAGPSSSPPPPLVPAAGVDVPPVGPCPPVADPSAPSRECWLSPSWNEPRPASDGPAPSGGTPPSK